MGALLLLWAEVPDLGQGKLFVELSYVEVLF